VENTWGTLLEGEKESWSGVSKPVREREEVGDEARSEKSKKGRGSISEGLHPGGEKFHLKRVIPVEKLQEKGTLVLSNYRVCDT